MNLPNPQRKEISQFLAEIESEHWRVLQIISTELSYLKVTLTVGMAYLAQWKFLKVYAHDAVDYAIRPPNPATIVGGPKMKFSIDDPRLTNPYLQMIPGGDGEVFNPRRRYQLLELDQTWIIAVRFEVELLESKTFVGAKAA